MQTSPWRNAWNGVQKPRPLNYRGRILPCCPKTCKKRQLGHSASRNVAATAEQRTAASRTLRLTLSTILHCQTLGRGSQKKLCRNWIWSEAWPEGKVLLSPARHKISASHECRVADLGAQLGGLKVTVRHSSQSSSYLHLKKPNGRAGMWVDFLVPHPYKPDKKKVFTSMSVHQLRYLLVW
jgi:hypothetical protein